MLSNSVGISYSVLRPLRSNWHNWLLSPPLNTLFMTPMPHVLVFFLLHRPSLLRFLCLLTQPLSCSWRLGSSPVLFSPSILFIADCIHSHSLELAVDFHIGIINPGLFWCSILLFKTSFWGLPWWRSGWESACQCGGHGFGPWSGRIPHAAEQLGLCAKTTEPVL